MTKATSGRKPKRKATAAKPSEPATVLVLRTCEPDGSSHNGFKWPLEAGAIVECPDWQATQACGNGLHGWLWGSGNWGLKAQGDAIKWLVLEVDRDGIIDLGGKVKFQRAVVKSVHGNWRDAMQVIRERILQDRALEAFSNEDSGHAAATGDSWHAAATGKFGHAAAAYGGTVCAGENGVLSLLWFDEATRRPRLAVAYVGENGIKPKTWYRLDVKDGAATFVEADDETAIQGAK